MDKDNCNEFQVKIRNYQRIRKADLVFGPGLNVIVGPSNTGKTACLRSILTAVFNLHKDSHVTMGEDQSAVGIRYNGHEVIWKRNIKSASKSSYKIDGAIYTKVGKGQLKEVADALKIFEVVFDDARERLNFQRQMSYPFLLDRTPSQVFKFLAQSAEEENLMAIINQMKTDYTAIAAAIKANQASMDAIKVAFTREKEAFEQDSLKIPTCKQILALADQVKQHKELGDLIFQLEQVSLELASCNKKIAQIRKIFPGILKSLAIAEKESVFIDILRPFISKLTEYRQAKDFSKVEVADCNKRIACFSVLPTQEDINTSLELEQKNKALNIIEQERKSYIKLTVFYEGKLKAIKAVVEEADNSVSSFSQLEREVNALGSAVGSLSRLRDERNDAWDCVDICSRELANIAKQLAEFSVCPYCGSYLHAQA